MALTNMSAVSIDINMAWQIINFIILVVIFNKYMKAPLAKILSSRREAIVNDLTQAEEAKKIAEINKKEIEELMKKARKDASDLIYNAEKKAAERQELILTDAKSQRDKILKAAELETQKLKEALKKDLTNSLRETAATMAAELLIKRMDKDMKNSLLDEFIEEVGEVKW
ncbi:MAG: F0F1 ATP synthase subunit B [Fusobacteriaceae bacterium]